MSAEERLRRGLAANTAHLQPSLDIALGALLRRAQQRRRMRQTGSALTAAAAAVAGMLVFHGLGDRDRATLGPAAPEPGPTATLAPTPLETMSGAVPPGTYAAGFPHATSDVRAIVEVPDGFTTDRGFLFLGDRDAAGLRAIGFWTVAEVHTDPCYGSGSAGYHRPGPTVQDLATALARQPLRASTGDPVPVSLGGYDGLYLELAAPADLDVAGCADGKIERWRFDGSDRRWQGTPGELDRIWIIDVDDERVVINAVHTPGTSQADIDQLTRTVTSITFTNSNKQ